MTFHTDAELCTMAQTQGPGLEFVRAAAEREMVDRYWAKARYEARDFDIVLVDRDDRESAALGALLAAVRKFDPDFGIVSFWDGYAKTVVRNRLTDRKRWSERRLDATGGPVLSIEADEEQEEGGGISGTIADSRVDVDAQVAARRTLAGVKARLLARYIAATGDLPVSHAVKSAIKAFIGERVRAKELAPRIAADLLAAVRQESSQMVLLGIGATAEGDEMQRVILSQCVECQIALATSIAIGDSIEEAAGKEGVSAPTARRLLAGLRRTLRRDEEEEGVAA